jgi:DNA-binding response OmpR family regulator
MKALVIEDKTLIAGSTRTMLNEIGFSEIIVCSAYSNPAQVAAICQPDLIVLDYSLKEKAIGSELNTILKATCNTPVIFLSTSSEEVTKKIESPVYVSPTGAIHRTIDKPAVSRRHSPRKHH